MKSNLKKLFPEADYAAVGSLNINELAIEYWRAHPRGIKNDFLDPYFLDQQIHKNHAERHITWSYGGYHEDRSDFLADTYLQDTGNFLHLGIDCNLPACTVVASPFDGVVLAVDDDKDIDNGWGPRIILRASDPAYSANAVILGHLKDPLVVAGDRVHAGDTLATIGAAPQNGNWFEHLHLQCINMKHFDSFDGEISKIDGYGHPSERAKLRELYPDPEFLLRNE